MVQNGPKLSKIVQSGSKWSKFVKLIQIGKIGKIVKIVKTANMLLSIFQALWCFLTSFIPPLPELATQIKVSDVFSFYIFIDPTDTQASKRY